MLFSCPLCFTNRDFSSLYVMFRHVTLYHQNSPNFKITCNLHSSCGVLYRTYSAYKAHMYRRHLHELNSTEYHDQSNTDSIDDPFRDKVDIGKESIDISDEEAFDFIDCNSDFMSSNDYLHGASSSFISSGGNEQNINSIRDIKKTFFLFILQLRDDFLLPKNVMTVITTYITTLIRHMEILLRKRTFDYPTSSQLIISSSSRNQTGNVIQFEYLKCIFNDICSAAECITKNEYQLIKHSEEYFSYSPVEEIALSLPSEEKDFGYYIPIEKSLSSMLSCRSFANEILQNVHQ